LRWLLGRWEACIPYRLNVCGNEYITTEQATSLVLRFAALWLLWFSPIDQIVRETADHFNR
jgi:hypothetical protein